MSFVIRLLPSPNTVSCTIAKILAQSRGQSVMGSLRKEILAATEDLEQDIRCMMCLNHHQARGRTLLVPGSVKWCVWMSQFVALKTRAFARETGVAHPDQLLCVEMKSSAGLQTFLKDPRSMEKRRRFGNTRNMVHCVNETIVSYLKLLVESQSGLIYHPTRQEQ